MVEVLMLWLHHQLAAADLKPYGDIVFMFMFLVYTGQGLLEPRGLIPPLQPHQVPARGGGGGGGCLTGQRVRDGGSDGRGDRRKNPTRVPRRVSACHVSRGQMDRLWPQQPV